MFYSHIDSALAEQGFFIVDNFLEDSAYRSLLAAAKKMDAAGLYKKAKIGRDLNASHQDAVRTDRICWLEDTSTDAAINAYFSKMQALANTLNQSLFLSLSQFEAHFAIYQPGTFYRKHVDQFANTQDRQISCVYYLNEDWQKSFSGELKLYNKQQQLIAEVAPEGNRFICFRSDLPHEVCETNVTRYSIAGWMKTGSDALAFTRALST
ncbi:MAG: 2OG-Fe(II) oxygenase [Tatlockia sp.]|jgi:SM-20-related protein